MAYFDHAATGLPKCPEGLLAARDAFDRPSPGRGHHRAQQASQAIVDAARASVAALTGGHLVIFGSGATWALNQAILGLRPRLAVVGYDVMSHNATRRPLAASGAALWPLPCNAHGQIDPLLFWNTWRPGTDTIVLTHGSNVTGVVQDVATLTRMAHQKGARVIVDAAQTVGTLPALGLQEADVVAFSGHKGLRSIQGVGCLLLRPGLDVDPLCFGGTGGESLPEAMPADYPQHLEAGTLNLPGIASLGAATRAYRPWPSSALADELRAIVVRAGFRPLGRGLLPVVSFQAPGLECAEAGTFLDEHAGITVRTGLHCAPSAHLHLGTCPVGTIRVSGGPSTSRADLDQLARGLAALRARVRL